MENNWIYKGYTIWQYTRNDFVVLNEKGHGFIVHEKTLKAAKMAIDKLDK